MKSCENLNGYILCQITYIMGMMCCYDTGPAAYITKKYPC